jgi:tRNA-specific 2-thiouridylase
VRLPEFLQQKLQPKEGVIIEIPAEAEIYYQEKPQFNSEEEAFAFESKRIDYLKIPGKVMGKHQGAHYFTKGQRKGLNVGGTKEPLFIIETDVEKNIVYTGQGNQHPGLFKKALFIANDEIHWIREDLALKEGEKMEVMARIRYRQPLQKATLHQFKGGMYVFFENPQSAITEGQFVAWHLNDEILGSGVIA